MNALELADSLCHRFEFPKEDLERVEPSVFAFCNFSEAWSASMRQLLLSPGLNQGKTILHPNQSNKIKRLKQGCATLQTLCSICPQDYIKAKYTIIDPSQLSKNKRLKLGCVTLQAPGFICPQDCIKAKLY